MKQNLKRIYQELSTGKLSQKDALEKIRVLKLQEQEGSLGTLLFTPVWESEAIAVQSKQDQFEYTRRHIVLCELPNVNVMLIEKSISNSHCLLLRTSRQKNIAERFNDVAQSCFELIKKILMSKPSGKVLVQIAIPNNQEETIFAGLSGLLKTAALENPQIIGQIILATPNGSTEELVSCLQAESTVTQDKMVKYENGTRHILRLQELHTNGETNKNVFKDQGVYLITGGLGGLGLLFAREIVKQTSKAKIILTGRSALTNDKKKILESLSADRKSVEYRQVDIADLDQMKQLIAAIKEENKQLNGIIHCAGLNIDNFILKKSPEEFSRVLSPKVTGTFNLDQVSHDIDLDFIVLFSSVASLLGNSGQADYATGNSFMDQFAVYRNSLVKTKKRNGKTLSINWPLWQEGGMTMDQVTQKMLEDITGLRTLQTSTGILNFYRTLELQHGQVMVMDGDYKQMRQRLFENQKSHQEIVQAIKPSANGIDLISFFDKAQDFICKQLAAQLKIAVHQLDPKAPLEKYGIDSILSLNLTTQLEKTFGSLPKTLFFEYQTIHDLTEYFIKSYPDTLTSLFATNGSIKKEHSHSVDATPKSTSQIQTRKISGGRFIRQQQEVATKANTSNRNDSNDPIAIVGLSGRYPESKDIQVYWQNLRDGKDCIIEVPEARWDWRNYYTEDRTKDGHHYSKWGGFIEGVDEFDPRFFNISPKEAEIIDPQERLFLQHAWMAVEDAGYTRASLQIADEHDMAGQVGVYVGVMYGEYQLFGTRDKGKALINSYASIANRVSYVLNLHGPSMTLDTMCSSSLTAIHLACQDLKLGRTNLAIAGGVNISIHPTKYLFLSAGQFISSDGHCQSFGEGGDGYIPGEGVGVVILKRLSEAVRDGNHIYGIIKGSSLNHGGKTNGYSVPNPKAQASAISRALSESNIDARHISYIEAHGTGTKLGDPIEIAALSQAFNKHTQDNGFCLIGSAKSNIGHCESAAGIAGLTKVLLQMQHQQIVPSLHSTKLNPHIDFQKTPFVVNQKLRTWDRPVIDGQHIPRIAGVSSFGAGGSNAHIILQEYVSAEQHVRAEQNVLVIIPLSARTEDQLKQKAKDLLDFIQTSQLDLVAMAYTFQVGREAMEERLGFIVSSIDQLADKLNSYIKGGQNIEDFYQGQVKRNKEALSLFSTDADLQQTIDKWIVDKKFSKLLDLWVKGLELDWNKLYNDNRPNWISLPTYPFAKERYWVDTTDTTLLSSKSIVTSILHPLLHVNTSDMMQQRYSSTFSGKESFFTNDQEGQYKILRIGAYLEMARVAIEKAMPKQQSSIIELHNVVWGEPFTTIGNKQITVELFAKNSDQVDFEIYSQDDTEDVVHCQGQAIFIINSAETKLDIVQLKHQNGQGANQLLAEIYHENIQDDYILHPALIDKVLQASLRFISNKQSSPFAVECIRILSACTKEMFVWVRHAQKNKLEDAIVTLDVDLCDQRGEVCVQMRSIAYQQVSQNAPALVSTPTISAATPQTPRQIFFASQIAAPKNIEISEPLTQSFTEVELRKPITLNDLTSEKIETTAVNKTSVVLSSTTNDLTTQERKASAVSLVSLFDNGNGIFLIQIGAGGNNALSQDLIQELRQAFSRIEQEASVKAVILSSTSHNFLNGERAAYNEAIEQKLFQAIASFPYPLIASIPGDAIGTGILVGALCDFMIYSDEANYCYAQDGLYPTEKEYKLFEARFGAARAKDFLNSSTPFTGKQLKEKGWTCSILPKENVKDHAQKLASALAKKSAESLRLLKKHLARHIIDLTDALTTISSSERNINKTNQKSISNAEHNQVEMQENGLIGIQKKIESLLSQSGSKEALSNLSSGTPIALQSKVVTATVHQENILVVKMEDREAKNMFSDALTEGITEVFAHIEKAPEYKVVVLTGYDNYFASGGTKETLLSIQEGKTKFTDNKIYQIAMTCKLPVIAAMQGHAVGAGWAMGMFADFVLLSEESKYFSPYMNYGFTPGAGATFIFPEKIGLDLSRETLLTAQEYSGSELKERGLSIPVLPREKVLSSAMLLARQIANYSREDLIAFKYQLTSHLHQKVEETYSLELAMHEKTFVGHSDTLEQINDNFYYANNSSQKASTQLNIDLSIATSSSQASALSEVSNITRKLLAQELHLQEHEIDDNTQFIDLGLDSITGVTWIRKINEKYKTLIEATKIYSYPTLAQLSRFVRDEAIKVGTVSNEPEVSLPVASTHVQQYDKVIITQPSQFVDNLPAVKANIKKLLAEELHLQENEIDENTQFIDLGLDSITGVTWIRRINEKYKTSIEATKIYSYPTLAQLSRYAKDEAEKAGTLFNRMEISQHLITNKNFTEEAGTTQSNKTVHATGRKLISWRNRSASKRTLVNSSDQSEPIAVIGMAGQFPMAQNLDEFWKNISSGKNCISEIPMDRWDVNAYYNEGEAIPGKTNSKWAGLLNGYDLFDPLFFNISPTEAESMDPQQRVLLEACWHSIENAGYNPKTLSGSKCGVYVGCASGDYHLLSRELQISAQGFTGGATSILAARISYLLNLQGPCLSIDTACSSSLVAIATACDSLISGNCDLALAGGVYVMVGPDMHIKSSQSGMLSRDGKCHTFDSKANGFVPGEGVGVVMLKRLSDAEKDNDIIYGVIHGWGVNQDGKTNGITAPNEESQTRLEQGLYDKFQIDPNSIQLIEAHGTGTKLGDPIEVNALKESFKKYTNEKAYCALGSVKSNIGHCLTAAGVASFIKTLLALKHKQLPPTINYNKLNEHIALTDSPFYINDKLREWKVEDETQRKAAISAFGFSGTNAHIVVGEYVAPVEVKRPVSVITQNAKVIVPLSARTADQLKQKASDLLDFIQRKEAKIDLVEVAYTLQVGREAMGERLGLMVSSIEQLEEKLQAFVDGNKDIQDVYQGQVKNNKESLSIINRDDDLKKTIIDTWISQKKLSKLIDLWVKGMEFEWNKLYDQAKPKRISLPEYPFAKERYWFSEIKSLQDPKADVKISALHPLLHKNISDLNQQCYSSVFSGNEFFTSDHQINGNKVLPAFACIEMAHVAVMQAMSNREKATGVELFNIVWDKPFFVGHDKEVFVTLFENDNESIVYEIFSSESGSEIIHCRGEVFFSDESGIDTLNIAQLKAQTGKNSDQLFVSVDIPTALASTKSDFCLHPSIMDIALEACRTLIVDERKSSLQSLQPVALDSITIVSECEEKMYVWVRYAGEGTNLDLDLCDTEGNICVKLRGLELSYLSNSQALIPATLDYTGTSWDKVSYISKWEEQSDSEQKNIKNHKSVLIICSGSGYHFEATIKEFYKQNRNCEVTLVRMSDRTEQLSEGEWTCDVYNAASLERCLQKTGAIDALYFLAMNEQESELLILKELVKNQESNEIQLLRIVKNLKANSKISDQVDTYILTRDNYSVNHLSTRCFGAGATGFAYSLAQGKYQFLVRNIDLSSNDLKLRNNHKNVFETIYHSPFSSRGEVFKVQSGKRYRQEFFKLEWDTKNSSAIRQNGVYVIVGGSGTVGKVISMNLIQRYNAQVIWIGRSAHNSDKVQAALHSCQEFSDNVFYYEADVKDQSAMHNAIELVKEKFAQIHGAVFAGMVFDFENSIDETTEDEFRSILEVKTQGSWIFYSVLQKEKLDFLCYFSSGQAYSFSGASKLSAYATAITFSDRLVQSISKHAAFPVGIVNWGFWKSSVNVMAKEAEGVSTENLDALEDHVGFGCFEKFVSELKVGRINHVLCMKVSKQMESLINIHQDEYVTLANESFVPSALEIEIPREKIDELLWVHEQDQLEYWLAKLLFRQFNNLIQSSGQGIPETVTDLQKQCKVIDKYLKWFNEGLSMLAAHNYIQLKGDVILNWKTIDTKSILDEWQLQKEKYFQDVEVESLVILLDDCLQKLPDILQGHQLATDVIFPNSSMEKVEGIYKNNTTSDTFNEVAANTIVAYLQQKLKSDPQSRLRILEIGAGTGGTSTIVFKKLKPFQKSIEKYCYTDLSKAFFFHAEKNYVPENPYIQCQRLDIEKPIKDQNIEIGSYDLVIATNVLHATKNIRNTLRNAKAAMHRNGLIILNEMSDKSLSTHLTFGLLDGWWLFEDANLRIPNCPGLYASGWQQVLEEEGFTAVKFPVQDAHILGQQIILAQSDGVVRQKEIINAEQKVSLPVEAVTRVEQEQKSLVRKSLPVVKPQQNVKTYVKDTILAAMAGTLRMSADTIDAEIAFSDYGIDSILGVNFVNQVNSRFSISLNTAIIFEYSSLDKLSDHVLNVYREQIEKQLNAQQDSSSNENDEFIEQHQETLRAGTSVKNESRSASRNISARNGRETRRENRSSEIAVVGISGMMPKANTVDVFWNNIINGVDGIEELPSHYLDHKAYFSSDKQYGKTRCKWGGIVDERDCFDPLFFNLSPWEAESMNPHQRLVLQEGWKAIENAGYNPKNLSNSKTGVFVGAEPSGYYGETFTGYSDAIISSRLSYILNLKGPAMTINTGCSSSGVALHLAYESLRNKETDLAIAGGVNACMDQSTQIRLDEIDMLSPKGRCNTFDAGGSGTIISEGIGMVVLKRLEDAIASNDFIYGVICGSGVNQDGASNGITAPNGAAQEELIVDVYKKYNINPEDITYVEAHGTGTKLGDPIEANALVRAFKKFTAKRSYCSVGSAKSHVGHTGAAAAVTGLIKVLQSLHYKRIPKLLHFNTINPLIEFKDSPFYISTQASTWQSTGEAPRMAALNSFGHSGTNVHLVIKEYVPHANGKHVNTNSRGNGTVIIPLSAKTIEQLEQKAIDLLEFIWTSGPMDLIDVAYTLQTGRDAMDERLGFVVSSVEQLAEKLQLYINGQHEIEGFYKGQAKRSKEGIESIEKLIADKKYSEVLSLWVKGIELDWNIFYAKHKPKRIGLPSYPFAKERYWYTKVKSVTPAEHNVKSESKNEFIENIDAIEDILNRIEDDSMEKEDALSLLKGLGIN